MKVVILFFLLPIAYCLLPTAVFSQRSKDGAKVVATANNIVNEYTSLAANAAAGATTITVANSTLNANSRFPGNLAPGDLIMIIQIQGATILGQPWIFNTDYGDPRDSTWGEITNYNNCGNWEFAQVYSVPNATSITLDCPLANNYTSAGRVVVVRVPRYSSLTINSGGSITCDTWNGTIGGICAIEVENNTVINAGGSINITGKGFRGAALLENLSTNGANEAAAILPDFGAEKGEGIAGYQADYDPFGGRYCKASPGNGGGGGNDHNCGGAGGANGGNILLWNGHGNPDNMPAGWTSAWNLQWPGFAALTSSGGGQGGYSFSGNGSNPNATTTAPNNSAWGGDWRRPWGGFGGRPLDYSTGRLFLGGGGGSGDQNNNDGGSGGNGGGLVYLMNYGTVSGAGQIISNGNPGGNTTGVSPAPTSYTGNDAAGGGGAGGTLIINSVGAISGISLTANGEKGGDQIILKGLFITTVYEAEGPGGGGGGGYIAISNGAPVQTVNGGANGITNSDGLTEFTANGATKGGAGSTGTVTNFIINSTNVTICAGQQATLTATLSGIVPGGTTITWYDNLVAGNVLGTGSTYTTPVLAAGTYTYYVGTCPGTYHQPVIVTVTNSGVVSAGNDVTICSGANTTLSATGGTGYVWSPATGLSNPNISNPVANPVSTTTYVVTVTSSCGNANDTVVVTVNSSITASISGNTTICAGGNTTLTASGGGNYSWSTTATTAAINVSPTTTTTYSVIVGSGSCADTASATVVVSSGITASISGNTTICPGSPTTLIASGGSNYSWSTTATTAAITVSPTATTTYSVIATSGSCSDTTSITVTITNNITATITGATTICAGGNVTLSASGGNNYSWSTSATTSSITVAPTATTTYTVIASSGTCADTAFATVTIGSGITASISGNTTICAGGSTTLTASGGSNFSWSTGATTAVIVVTPTGTTNYSVVATSGSCAASTSVTVAVNPNPTPTISGNTSICNGTAATLTAGGGSFYSWSTGATTTSVSVSPSAATNYTVTATDANGCTGTASASVTIAPSPSAGIGGNTVLCIGDATTLTGTGGGTYLWSTGATSASITVTPASTGNTTYTVTVTNTNGCTDTAAVTVSVSPPPNAVITGNTTICAGETATLTASGGATYSWSNGASTNSAIFVSSGTYSVIASIGNCADTASATITINPPPNASAGASVLISIGESATLNATGGISYSWSPSAGLSCANCQNPIASPLVTTEYCVTVTDANGCTDSSCVRVYVDPIDCSKSIYLPNAFSPNNDLENDELQLYGNLLCIKAASIVIYNRWGEEVFKSDKADFKWAGDHKGKKSGTGAFAFHLELALIDGTFISKKGNISLVR